MNELIEKVEQWAIDKDLHKANPKAQALKVIEEFTEMLKADAQRDVEEVVDGIGDTYVTLIILCQQLELSVFRENKPIHEETRDAFCSGNGDEMFVVLSAINQFSTGVSKSDVNKICDAIAKIREIADVLAEEYGSTPVECLSIAYDEIKDRTGMMVDGVFVKSEDLQ